MERVIQLADHFNVPSMICLNKFDLNANQTRAIENYAKKKNIPVLGEIPFDPIFIESMIQGQTIFEYGKPSQTLLAVKHIWNKINELLPMRDK
jgi:MinD superfamily P-loop ATPase